MINKWTGLFLGAIIGFVIGALPWTMVVAIKIFLVFVKVPDDSPGIGVLVVLATPFVCSVIFAFLGFLFGRHQDKKIKKI